MFFPFSLQKCCCFCSCSNCCVLVKYIIYNSVLCAFDTNETSTAIYLLELLQLCLRKKFIPVQQHKNIYYVIVLCYSRYCSNMYMIITLPTQTFFVSLERKKLCNYQSYANYD